VDRAGRRTNPEGNTDVFPRVRVAIRRSVHGGPGRGGVLGQALSRTLLLPSGEQDELVEVDGLVAGAAVAVPTAQEGLQQQYRLRECQAGRGAFGHIRSSVRKACAQVTSAQWWWKPR
jgi:hypothetical protein